MSSVAGLIVLLLTVIVYQHIVAAACDCMCVDDADMMSMTSGRENGSVQLIGSAVWCLASHSDIVIAGCRNGAIEVCICCHICTVVLSWSCFLLCPVSFTRAAIF